MRWAGSVMRKKRKGYCWFTICYNIFHQHGGGYLVKIIMKIKAPKIKQFAIFRPTCT